MVWLHQVAPEEKASWLECRKMDKEKWHFSMESDFFDKNLLLIEK